MSWRTIEAATFRMGVSPRTIYLEWARLCEYAEIEPTPVVFSRALDEEHRENPRRYAQIVVQTGELELADAFRHLYPDYRLGIYAHEIGHRIMIEELGQVEHSEAEADHFAEKYLGVKIAYDRRWPGKGLQCAIKAPRVLYMIVDPSGYLADKIERRRTHAP